MSREAAPAGPRSPWLLRVQVLGTVVLVAVLLYAVPLREALGCLGRVDLTALGLALLAELGHRALFILRWPFLLPATEPRCSFLHTLRLGFVGLFYNNFMISTLGGDTAKSVMMVQEQKAPAGDVVASVMVDRLVIGWGSLLLFGLAASAFVEVPSFRQVLLAVFAAGVCCGIGAVVLLRRQPRSEAPDTVAGPVRRLLTKAADTLAEIANALLRYRRRKLSLAGSFLASCCGIVVMGAAVRFWALAVGFPISLTEGSAVAVIVKIAGIVPVAINGLGWIEGAFVVLLQWAGMGRAEAFTVALMQRAAGILLSLLGAAAQFITPRRPGCEAWPGALPRGRWLGSASSEATERLAASKTSPSSPCHDVGTDAPRLARQRGSRRCSEVRS